MMMMRRRVSMLVVMEMTMMPSRRMPRMELMEMMRMKLMLLMMMMALMVVMTEMMVRSDS